jgi:hypothetical protein
MASAVAESRPPLNSTTAFFRLIVIVVPSVYEVVE